MKPTTIKLLKDNPEAFKEVAIDYGMYYCTHESFKDEKVWNSFISEALKPDWEILEFRDVKHTYIKYNLQYNGFYSDNSNGELDEFSLTDILNGEYSVRDGKISINSVRRSDGEVFKEDHWVSWLSGAHKGKITAFELDNDNTMNAIVEGKPFPLKIALFNLTKLQPLFKTEDGKDYYKGDPLFEVYGKDKTDIAEIAKFRNFDVFMMDLNAGHRLAFSTREAAEQWVNDHKPSVSIAQLKQAGLSEDIINSLRPF